MIDEEAEEITCGFIRKTVEGLLLLADVVVGENLCFSPDLPEDFVAKKRNGNLIADAAGIDDKPAGPAFFEGSF